tara:strand:+ start:42 stop:536 length:495 start_codon:yes stop_codon:yes gene_type:complete
MNKIGIYPGTFDPMTNGHIDIVKRSVKLVDKLIIGVADNLNKKPLLTIDDRINIIKNDIKEHSINFNIEIQSIKGLLTSFAQSLNATCIIRGLRVVSDFEYEFQMTGMNYKLNSNIETIFLMSSDNNSFISSNFVKEVHKLGGDVSSFVSKNTINILNNKNSSS